MPLLRAGAEERNNLKLEQRIVQSDTTAIMSGLNNKSAKNAQAKQGISTTSSTSGVQALPCVPDAAHMEASRPRVIMLLSCVAQVDAWLAEDG